MVLVCNLEMGKKKSQYIKPGEKVVKLINHESVAEICPELKVLLPLTKMYSLDPFSLILWIRIGKY